MQKRSLLAAARVRWHSVVAWAASVIALTGQAKGMTLDKHHFLQPLINLCFWFAFSGVVAVLAQAMCVWFGGLVTQVVHGRCVPNWLLGSSFPPFALQHGTAWLHTCSQHPATAPKP